MKWYEEERERLDYGLPIISESNSARFILLPQIKQGSYVIVGYNWFNLEDGGYNSNCFYKTAKEAVRSYSHYKQYNLKIPEDFGCAKINIVK